MTCFTYRLPMSVTILLVMGAAHHAWAEDIKDLRHKPPAIRLEVEIERGEATSRLIVFIRNDTGQSFSFPTGAHGGSGSLDDGFRFAADPKSKHLEVFGTAPTIGSPSLSYAVNAQTGTTYTTVLLDAGKVITSSNASAVTVTIPPNSSVAYPVGSSITVISIGAGLTSFAQGAGVTITSTGAVASAPVLRAQHSSATAIKTATDTWRVVGDIA